jgi:hypothetical protein
MATSQEELTSAVNVDIAEGGKVVLIVGPEERRLCVSVSSLKNVSKVFHTTFGPHFSEGQNLGDISSGPKEVQMPEDNADAIEIICSMMHFCNVPQEVGLDLMLHIAIAADKFDCSIVLQHASMLWLDLKKPKNLAELARLMAASYILNNSKTFSQVTLAMAFGHRDSYLALEEQEIGLHSSVLLRICCTFLSLVSPTENPLLTPLIRSARRAAESVTHRNRADTGPKGYQLRLR